jgi:hypothetical protein
VTSPASPSCATSGSAAYTPACRAANTPTDAADTSHAMANATADAAYADARSRSESTIADTRAKAYRVARAIGRAEARIAAEAGRGPAITHGTAEPAITTKTYVAANAAYATISAIAAKTICATESRISTPITAVTPIPPIATRAAAIIEMLAAHETASLGLWRIWVKHGLRVPVARLHVRGEGYFVVEIVERIGLCLWGRSCWLWLRWSARCLTRSRIGVAS